MNLVSLTAVALLTGACAADTHVAGERSVRQIFAEHDCCGRLANTSIAKIGVLRGGDRRFEIYDLYFVNPVSEHGLSQVAIVEGDTFVGSYQNDGAIISIKGDDLHFSCRDDDANWCKPDNHQIISFRSGRLPQHILINGTVVQRDDSI